MNHVARMQVLGRPEELIQNVLFVDFFEDVSAFDDVVKVRVYPKLNSFSKGSHCS
jgi:hypothetical protein